MVEDGKYSFNTFVNISNNKDKYTDTNIIEDLFMNGKTYHKNELLNSMSSLICVGLIGNKDVRISEE
ncbi:MAG: hypothetical protein IJU54_00985 [Alphaproteobacteria bacterium]|nr:hypothetical protein [Alphaproteobacteria bacterium]